MKKKGFLSGLLGTLLVIAGVFAATVLSSLLVNVVFKSRLAGEPACAIMNLTLVSIVVYFVLLEVIFFTWQVKLVKNENKRTTEESKKCIEKICRIIYASCVCGIILFALINVNTYTEYRENGISEKFFVTTKSYTWKNVSSYTLSCSDDGTIEYTVRMKDGKSFELINKVNSCSDEFIEKHENMYGYAAFLSETFDNQSNYIERRISGISNMERYYKEAYPDIWKHLEKIIDGYEP